MKTQLVKIDVASHLTGWSIRKLFELADGMSPTHNALLWVFDLSRRKKAARRDLRFWEPELMARASDDVSQHNKYCGWELDWVMNRILPPDRRTYVAGEVDLLFQFRSRTRLDFGPELNGDFEDGRNHYDRATLLAFLKARHHLRKAPRFSRRRATARTRRINPTLALAPAAPAQLALVPQ